MEDDNGLELRLGLSCGKSSTTPRARNGSSSETRIEEVDRGSKIIDDFRNFLHAGTQKSDSVKPEENFFDNLSSPAIHVDTSTNLNGGEFWIANNNKPSEADEENRLEASSKSRSVFDEITLQKKRRRDSETTRASHISINTDEGSTAENEDIADSEAEGSTSRLIIHHNDNSKRDVTGGGLTEVPKEVHGVSSSSGLEKGQNRFTISSESEPKVRNVSYGIPFPNQSANIMNMPYNSAVKESNPSVVPGTSKHALPGIMHMMATSNSERPANQHMMPANSHLTFGYSPGQLPVLDKENSQGLVPQSQQLNSSYFIRGLPDSEKQNGRHKLSEVMHKSGALQYDGNVLEAAKADGNNYAVEEGSSSQTGNNVKQNSIMVGQNTSDQPRVDGCASEFQAIEPGIAGDLKFSGTGSVPDLPWVSTTGTGPKGRTISGVTYRVGTTQVRIVCACHGLHMSPEEFVVHANEDQQTNQGNGSGVVFPSSNSAASAQS